LSMTVLEVASAALTSPLDKTALASGTGTAASVGPTATLSQASEIVIGDIGFNGAVALSGQTSGYATTPLEQSTASGNNSGEQAAYKILTTLGAPPSYGATLNSSKAWTGAIATFKTGAPTTTTITGFSPPSGPVGTVVTITGAGFTGATVVKFNTTTATTFSVTDDGHLNATVPTGATSGFISVTAPGGTASSSPTSFSVTTAPTAPHIMLIVEENHSYSGTGGVIGNSQ